MRTLTDGGQTADQVAGWIADFLAPARETLDLALYDVRVPGTAGEAIAGALRAARDRGVRISIATENVLDRRDAALADRTAAFVDEVRDRYPAIGVPEDL